MTELLDVSLWKHWQIPPYCAHVVRFNPASVNCQHFCGSGSRDFLTPSNVRDVRNVYHTQHMLPITAGEPFSGQKFIQMDKMLIRVRVQVEDITTVLNPHTIPLIGSLCIHNVTHFLSFFLSVWCLSSRHDVCSASFAERGIQSKHQTETSNMTMLYRQKNNNMQKRIERKNTGESKWHNEMFL